MGPGELCRLTKATSAKSHSTVIVTFQNLKEIGHGLTLPSDLMNLYVRIFWLFVCLVGWLAFVLSFGFRFWHP